MGVSDQARALPIGNLAFLCAEIESDDKRRDIPAHAMRRALVRKLLAPIAEQHAGTLFKTTNDAFFYVFGQPEKALALAIDAQHALLAQEWPRATGTLRLRVALHVGPAVLRDRDYFGPTVNRVARLLTAAHPGQILLSAATAYALSLHLGDTHLRDLGTHRLRGDLGEPERIFQVIAPGLPFESVAPATLDAVPNNLPTQTSSFVGRHEDLKRLRELAWINRLVTIVGFGGMGKTRLALQLAAESSAEFADGCWFVGLKELDDPGQIAQTAADALRVRAGPGELIDDVLIKYLTKKRTLVIIDNAEHLLHGVAAFVKQILESTAETCIVVTSREPLHIPGEQTLRLEGLDEAVRLFIDRARAMTELELSDDTSASIAKICERLHGIPLAIELTAARMTSISLDTSEAMLRLHVDPFELEAEAKASNPLRATLEWSFDLLSREERRALVNLAAFEGSFTLEAAEAVAFHDAIRGQTLALLGSLTDKSLVSYVSDGDTSRYYLLEMVREFALEQLTSSNDAPAIGQRHCRFFMKLIQRLVHPSVNPQVSHDRISREWFNIRAALRVALEQRDDLEGGRLAVCSLWPFWVATGRTEEAWHWINLALQGDNIPQQLRGDLLQRAAHIAYNRSDVSAPKLAKLLVDMYERSNDDANLGHALLLLANTKVAAGAVDEAETYLKRALDRFRAIGDKRWIATALCALGTVAGQQHLNYAGAKQLLQHSLELFRAVEDSFGCVEVLGNLSVTAMRAGDFAEALDYGSQSLDLLRRLGNEADTVVAHLNIAEIYTEWHKPQKALVALRAARRVLASKANRLYQAYYYEAAFKLAVEFGSYRTAAQLYGYAARQRRMARTPLQPNERELLQSRTALLGRALDEATLRELVFKGSTFDVETVEGLIDTLDAPAPPSQSPT